MKIFFRREGKARVLGCDIDLHPAASFVLSALDFLLKRALKYYVESAKAKIAVPANAGINQPDIQLLESLFVAMVQGQLYEDTP
ncbi:unnamed protein product, partial [Mesorhabditis belari]|uniref:Uncharacterized protein n=1 Tax=Mesorhabditis belari TaxID=2138241 RepID=A0AAF3EX31_9BILA